MAPGRGRWYDASRAFAHARNLDLSAVWRAVGAGDWRRATNELTPALLDAEDFPAAWARRLEDGHVFQVQIRERADDLIGSWYEVRVRPT